MTTKVMFHIFVNTIKYDTDVKSVEGQAYVNIKDSVILVKIVWGEVSVNITRNVPVVKSAAVGQFVNIIENVVNAKNAAELLYVNIKKCGTIANYVKNNNLSYI